MDDHARRGGDGHIGVEVADMGARVTLALARDASGQPELVRHARFEQPPTPGEVIERLDVLMADAGDAVSAPIASIGVAVWGGVNVSRGEVEDVHFGADWVQYPFAERLAARLGAPVQLISGVNAAARAEALVGAGVGRSPLLYVHLGRSVASALLVNGQPLLGAHERAGRLGHWQTGLDGPRCGCGARGHLEPLISAQSLIRLAIGAAADDDDALAAIHRVTGGRAEALTAPQLIALAREGVRPLRELVDFAVGALAGALANLILTLDPMAILVGGPLALADDVFFAWLREQVTFRLSGIVELPEIGPATAEPRGALVGALTLDSH